MSESNIPIPPSDLMGDLRKFGRLRPMGCDEKTFQELETLRARVRSMDADSITLVGLIENLKASNLKLVSENVKQEARIRELEEAMPDPNYVRQIALKSYEVSLYQGQNGIGVMLQKMADRIEKVTNHGPRVDGKS